MKNDESSLSAKLIFSFVGKIIFYVLFYYEGELVSVCGFTLMSFYIIEGKVKANGV